jgi:hypothetical protein
MTLIEAAKQALEALEQYASHRMGSDLGRKAITALRTAIAEAEKQEPVAWKHDCAALLQNDVELWVDRCSHCGKPSTTPPAAQRQPLTEEQINKIFFVDGKPGQFWWERKSPDAVQITRAIEAAHGITGVKT